MSSSHNRKKPINNIHSSLKFSAFIHIKSQFSFSAHRCSCATCCSPKTAVFCLDWPAGHIQWDSRDREEAPAANERDKQRQQWGLTELGRNDSPPREGDGLSSRYQGGCRCHHLCPPLTAEQLPLGMSPAGRHMRGSVRPWLPRWDREQGNINLSVWPWESVVGSCGWCKPSQVHTARSHLGVTSAPSGTALHLLPTFSEAAPAF